MLHSNNTYKVCILFNESNVPFDSDWMLLSYNDNRLRLVRSLNESLRIHEISFAFSNNNCNDDSPRKTFVGRFFILLPYKTLNKLTFEENMRYKRLSREREGEKKVSTLQSTYSVVNDFNPVNASCAIREMLLFDKSIRRSRLKFENAFGVISVMKFCSNRLKYEMKCFVVVVKTLLKNCIWHRWGKREKTRTIRTFLRVAPMAQRSDFSHGNRQFRPHIGMDVDNYSNRHTRPMHFQLGLTIWINRSAFRYNQI